MEVGKRYLVKQLFAFSAPLLETTILEISPSRERVNFEGIGWVETWQWEIVEELPSDKKSKSSLLSVYRRATRAIGS